MISSDHYCPDCGAANTAEAEACFACGVSMNTGLLAPVETVKLAGQRLLKQRYRILEQVGKGGFSVVYKAEDTQETQETQDTQDKDCKVAIKAITLHGLTSLEIIEATEAFNREMLILSELKHRNLPRIHHHFSDTACWYLVMDYIEGTALEKHLEKMHGGRLPLEEVLDIGMLLCEVLAYLHGRQPPVIFRDLKPSNIMLTVDGHLALIDFGIARRFKPGQQKDTMVFGSPGYAAPEQYGKAQTTPRADIYSLGALLHQLLTGDDPSQNAFHFAPLKTNGEDALIRLNTMIMRMVEMDEKNRPQSITLVEQELRSIATAYRLQRLHGLQATNAPLYIPTMPSWQTTGLPPVYRGAATSSSGQAQIAMMQQQQQRQNVSGIGNPYYYGNAWAAGASTAAPRQGSGMALASMLFGFLSILMSLFICILSSSISFPYEYADYRIISLAVSLLLLTPTLLAIILGHIALNRIQKNPWLQSGVSMAKTGLAIGYIFGSIYAFLVCYILSWTFGRY